MSDDNAMDVDNAPKIPPPCIFRDISHQSPMCSSSPSLPQVLVDNFKKEMIAEASSAHLSERLINAGSDKNLEYALFNVLLTSWTVIKGTDLQKYVDFSSGPDIRKLLQSLNGSEVEELKSAVLAGDWARLITHRMCPTCFRGKYIVIWYRHSETSKTSQRSP